MFFQPRKLVIILKIGQPKMKKDTMKAFRTVFPTLVFSNDTKSTRYVYVMRSVKIRYYVQYPVTQLFAFAS